MSEEITFPHEGREILGVEEDSKSWARTRKCKRTPNSRNLLPRRGSLGGEEFKKSESSQEERNARKKESAEGPSSRRRDSMDRPKLGLGEARLSPPPAFRPKLLHEGKTK